MKHRIRIVVLLTALCLAAFWCGCGQERAPEQGADQDTDQTTEQAAEPTEGEPQFSTEVQGADGNDNNTEGNPSDTSENTPYGQHGSLSVQGTQLCDADGEAYQLKGVSTHGIAWFPQYVNKEAFSTIRDWGGNLVRLAVYTEEYNGYLSGGDQNAQKELIHTGVEAASELGMYVIIDWHILSDGNPNQHTEEAKAFFADMSGKYAGYGNVIYEICNEPNGGVSWNDIRSYADEVIPVIRQNAPDAVIIVGTPTWSQDVDAAAAEPLTYDNIMYACHFYAATHKQFLRDKAQNAMNQGIALFVSEYSICDASGSGGIDYEEAQLWADFMDEHQLSYAQWNLSNKEETSAILRSDCTDVSGWEDDDLSETGLWLKQRLQEGGR